ncbi:hypothetical protein LEP1GSC061_1732 [Leptospira wolffii serovar Khorat str. Khorat-H2]|nr:hypothetical protein LEP1GSC061_1732 [Leptospira wolffii serovar Khorat str. Khorat-H2]
MWLFILFPFFTVLLRGRLASRINFHHSPFGFWIEVFS